MNPESTAWNPESKTFFDNLTKANLPSGIFTSLFKFSLGGFCVFEYLFLFAIISFLTAFDPLLFQRDS